MNKITPLDFRQTVYSYPQEKVSSYRYSVVPFQFNEKVVSLFQSSPKVRLGPVLPRILRKGQIALFKVLEALRAAIEVKEIFNVFDEICPPRALYSPQLPHPPFRAVKPPRFFWHQDLESSNHEYAPPCLMSETPENGAVLIKSLPRQAKKGTLRQDDAGYVYLELSEGHIPVILTQEWEQKKGLGPIKELGDALSVEMKGLYSQRPKSWPGVVKVYFLRIHSSQLEAFREKYLLPSRIRGHDFHAVVDFKPGHAPEQKETFRLNVSCFAA